MIAQFAYDATRLMQAYVFVIDVPYSPGQAALAGLDQVHKFVYPQKNIEQNQFAEKIFLSKNPHD